MQKKQRFTLTAAALCMIIAGFCMIIGGCTRGKKNEIRFASWNNAEDLDKQQSLVDRFNQTHPEIRMVLGLTAITLIPKSRQV